MNGGDYAAIAIISLMALRVSFKGFVSEFSGKSGVIIGFTAALLFSPPFTLLLDSRFQLGRYAQTVSLLSLFVAGYILAKYLLSSLEDIFEILHLRAFDHVVGFALGALEGAFITTALVYLMGFQNTIDLMPLYETSRLLPYLYPVFPQLIEVVMTSLEASQ